MNNLTISGTVIKDKAISYAQELQAEKFNASNGWSERWKARFNVSVKDIVGEKKQ